MPRKAEALQAYRAKRHFGQTPEPDGAQSLAAGARFVVQKHAARRLHYDFRLELDGVLLSWAVTRGPSYDPHEKRLAVRTEDHPLAYGGFEGIIPRGQYGGGTVMLWDEGSWTPIGDPGAGLAAGKIAFELRGKRLRGRWALVRMKGKGETRENWLLIKERDELAGTRADVLAQDSSVTTGRSMAQIAAGAKGRAEKAPAPPGFAAPALATLVAAPPAGADWQFEIKYDGYRALIAVDGAAVRIFTRNGLDWTARYPGLVAAFAGLGLKRVLLDGEITVVGADGVSDFGALVGALEGRRKALTCFLFDVLVHEGRSVRGWSLARRRALLERLLGAPAPGAALQLSALFAGDGATLLATACAHGLEGLIAKRVEAPYRAGRHPDWLKIKCAQGQEFVVVGFVPSARPGRAFASLAMAVREAGGLRYAGRVGSGFSDAMLARLAAWRDAHIRKTPACAVPAEWEGVAWVAPELVAEIGFAGWTPDGLIRQGRFRGLRDDKPAEEVEREMPKPEKTLHITHPEKLLYAEAGLSKADVAAYVQRAAPLMWPYVKDRFLSLVRCPDGAEGKAFFQRHPAAGFGQDWRAQPFTNKEGKAEEYIYAAAPAALVAAVQMGTLEFHLWGARRDRPDVPDRLVFDLDPDPDLPFAAVQAGAERLRDVLSALGLASLPMLSGGKGVHVVVALRRAHDFATVKQFCGDVARRLAADAPDRFTATMSKASRHGRIFIDYFRNESGATAVAPFSPRARPGAGVAWPCSWAGLRGFASAQDMTIPRAMEALAQGSPWAGLEARPQILSGKALRAIAQD